MARVEDPVREESSRDLAGDVVHRLEAMILSGELGAGARLREPGLAASLGVSRGPLREAIRVLEGRRLLERTPSAGVRVVDPSIDDLEQILLTREALEGMAARLAAENMTLPEIRLLRETAATLQRIDLDEHHPLGVFEKGPDVDFHRAIALGSRNRWIARLLCGDLYSLLRLFRARAILLRDDSRPTHDEHRAIIDCIQRRDPEGAEDLMRAHVRRSRDQLLGHLKLRPARPVR
jgi:DNA-binding GntR family transcriptional regulator